MHYSFDYAQQVHYSQQVGPIFFKTPRKCGLFGITCEATSTHLLDEADVIGKGANATISMVHHYLQHHGLKVKVLHLHADNCVGQNKNNFVIQYLVWRTLANLNDEIELSFMLVGHTKFAPDRFYKPKTCIGSLRWIPWPISWQNHQFQARTNRSVTLVYAMCTGWNGPNSLVRTIPNITKYRHFKMKRENPGVVYLKEFNASTEEEFNLFKCGITSSSLRSRKPSEITPPGLDAKRQWYLFDEIRQFCSTNLAKDITCPKPLVPKPGSTEQPHKRVKVTPTHFCSK